MTEDRIAADYAAVFKRKSFHLFRGVGKERLADTVPEEILRAYEGFCPLYPDTRTAIRVVPAGGTHFKSDAEYCVLIYSEKKENYLTNVGYLGEQLDLWLVERGIGSLWFGFGKPDLETYEGLDFVIMMAIRRVSDETKFRRDLTRVKRKKTEEIWEGDGLDGVADEARYTPSACNSQPWYVKNEAGNLSVFRVRDPERSGRMTPTTANYFNRIDMGIYLYILEVCLGKHGFSFEKELYEDDGTKSGLIRVAAYAVSK